VLSFSAAFGGAFLSPHDGCVHVGFVRHSNLPVCTNQLIADGGVGHHSLGQSQRRLDLRGGLGRIAPLQ